MSDLVFNIRAASFSKIRAMDRHERFREPDGTSAIDPDRSKLNKILHASGSDLSCETPEPPGPLEALDRFYDSGPKPPDKRAEAPYLQIVISASGSYFRPDDLDAHGTWDEAALEAWKERTMDWLRMQFSQDLVHVSLHLDEDTPHIHALVAPTCAKKPRVPGRRKKNETPEQFKARRQEAKNDPGTRIVSRSSHPELSKKGSYTTLRQSLAMSLSDLDIQYGEDRGPRAEKGLSTREWVRREAVRIREKEQELEAEKQATAARTSEIEKREVQVEAREATAEQRKFDQDQHQRKLDNEAEAQMVWGQKLGSKHKRLDEREKSQDQRDRDFKAKEEELNAFHGRLCEKHAGLKNWQSKLAAVYAVVQQVIGKAAEKLGVESDLIAIDKALNPMTKESTQEPEDRTFEP